MIVVIFTANSSFCICCKYIFVLNISKLFMYEFNLRRIDGQSLNIEFFISFLVFCNGVENQYIRSAVDFAFS